MPQDNQFGTTRKYSKVLLLSVVTLGVYYLFYQLWLFTDLARHHEDAFQDEPEAYPTINNPTTLFIFLFFLPFYSYYVKYNILHEHIATTKISSSINCVVGYQAVLFFLFLGPITLGIVPLIMEIKWQKTFNEHIQAHITATSNKTK
ncbi:MAG: DUF4234 domain-containing protein [Candidatus Heimdallarchaeota archaeon]